MGLCARVRIPSPPLRRQNNLCVPPTSNQPQSGRYHHPSLRDNSTLLGQQVASSSHQDSWRSLQRCSAHAPVTAASPTKCYTTDAASDPPSATPILRPGISRTPSFLDMRDDVDRGMPPSEDSFLDMGKVSLDTVRSSMEEDPVLS